MLKKKGFTLIEMLVVVLIIGILAAIAFPQYQVAVLKSRYTQLMIMGDALRTAYDAYYLANGKYPLKINDLDITIPGDCTLIDNGGTMSCPKFFCTINDQWVNPETRGMLYCFLKPSAIGFSATPVWGASKRHCVAKNDIAKKVCESFGARYAFLGSENSVWYQM